MLEEEDVMTAVVAEAVGERAEGEAMEVDLMVAGAEVVRAEDEEMVGEVEEMVVSEGL